MRGYIEAVLLGVVLGFAAAHAFMLLRVRIELLLAPLGPRVRDERGQAAIPDWLAKLFRQPPLVLAVVGGFVNMMVLLRVWELDGQQTAGINTFFAALVALVAFVVTPDSEVVARQSGDGPVKAGKRAEDFGIVRGHAVSVDPVLTTLDPAPTLPDPGGPGQHRRDERGLTTHTIAVAALVIGVVVLVLLLA